MVSRAFLMKQFISHQLAALVGQLVFCSRLLIDAVTDLAFRWLYNKRLRRTVPPLSNRLLLESATALAGKIRRRELTSEALVTLCIERIKEVQPVLNAVVDERFQCALEDARTADRIVACLCDQALDGLAVDAPLLGVPFSTKEGVRVKGLHHSYGCAMRSEHRASQDADAVAMLRKAGAIPLCVTNVSELGTWWESSNSVYGQTNNPYDNRRTPGGSSGGEAAIQAAAAVPISLGSDTGGSIRTPAAFCGLFGHKPSAGIVSVRGSTVVDPPDGYVSIMTSLGPLSRHAEDLVPMLKAILNGHHEKLALNEVVPLSKLQYFYLDGTIGGPGVSQINPEVRQALMRVTYYLEDVFGIEVKPVRMPALDKAFDMFIAASDLEKYDPKLAKFMCRSLTVEWFHWALGKGDHNFPFLISASMEAFDSLWEKVKGQNKKENAINMSIETLNNEMLELLGDDGILLCPTHPTIAPYHHQSYFKPINVMYASIFNVLGMPATTIPVGLSNDEMMPLSIQVFH